VCDVQHWAEARRLFRDGWTKTAIAAKLGVSRNTVADLVASETPPRYERAPGRSMLDGFADAVAAVLAEDPTGAGNGHP
jgi:transcriptional regulator with XRE-family HTH domain